MSDEGADLSTLPPSVKFVRYVLADAEGGYTQTELAEETGLPKRTVRYALSELQRAGLVDRETGLHGDSRVAVYTAQPDN